MKEAIGLRIKAGRERRQVSQGDLAKAIGWNHHQITSDVEQGKREVKAWELFKIAQFLSIDMDILLGAQETQQEPYVLWREKPRQNAELLEAYFLGECKSYLWIEEAILSAKALSTVLSEELPRIKIDLGVFTFDQAYQLAESMRQTLGLGDFPATQLIDVLEDRYGVKFIVDYKEIEPSAACSRSEKGSFIFINGLNSDARQYFNIAHELFHLITWDKEMLGAVDRDSKIHEKNEQFANAFAAGLLLPREKIQKEVARICGDREVGVSDVIALAEQFQVSKEALLYRLVHVKRISKKDSEKMRERLQTLPSMAIPCPRIARLLRSKFVRLVYLAYQHVKISRAKAAKLLHVDLCDLSELFNEYGFVEIHA